MRVGLICVLLLTATGPLEAQTSGSSLPARELFERGVEMARTGDLAKALDFFEAAYAQSPNQTVLYNIAQTELALGRTLAAVGALRRYLAADEPPQNEARHREVEHLLQINERRVGRLALELVPSDAELEIDGVAISLPHDGVLEVVAGHHVVSGARSGFQRGSVAVDVAGAETTGVRLELAALPSRRDALISLACRVPMTDLTVDDARLPPSPSRVLFATVEGEHRVRFARRGYRPSEQVVLAHAGAVTDVECKLGVDPSAPKSDLAELHVLTSQRDARVFVDDSPWFGGSLPLGAHRLRVVRSGFAPWQREIQLTGGAPLVMTAVLTASFATRQQEHIHVRRRWAYAVAGLSVGFGALATTLAVINSDKYATWRRDQQALLRELKSGQIGADYASRDASLATRAATIQRTDDLTVGAALLGGLLLGVAGSLYWGWDERAAGEGSQR